MAIETLGSALHHINRLFVEGTVTGLTDAQLLERFLAGRDREAFEALMARHGPMVLRVCRGVLRSPSDAEDAFQATFLVLVEKARSLRGRTNLGGWLHRVAYRVAIQANAAAARRRVQERKAGEMAATTSSHDPVIPDELIPALHEEIARLPEKIRAVVVLCDLQGIPQDQAAKSLGLSERTLRRRLADGRERLKLRLNRRGLECSGAIMAALRLRESGLVIPPSWRDATLRAALNILNPTAAVGTISAAAQSLTREVLKTMFVHKLAIAGAALMAAGLLAWAASAALVPRGEEKAATAPVAPRADPGPGPAAEAGPLDETGTFPIRGRVLDPDGKPVAGAGVYVRHHAEIQWNPIDPMAARQKGRVAVTDADGRFRFELDKAASEVSSEGGSGWHHAQIAVSAPGFAPAWIDAGDLAKGGESTLRLVPDDVPVRGRVLDSQGRPVAGVVVRIRLIWQARDGLDLDAMLAAGELDEGQMARQFGLYQRAPTWQADPAPLWPGGRDAWTTDADGRFEVRGIGRDRIARLDFHGGGVADGTVFVMARPARTPPRARPAGQPADMLMFGKEGAFKGRYPQGTQLVGATFDYIAGPTKPIAGVVRLKGSGKPVEGAIVHGADPATHTSVTARTDAAGRFRLDGVPKGAFYQLRFTPRSGIDRFLGHAEILDDTEGLKPIETTIEVPPGVIVTGRLVDKATGRAVPPAYINYLKAPDNVGTGDPVLGFSRLADSAFGLTVPPGHAMIAALVAVSTKEDPYLCARLRAEDRGKGIGGFDDDENFKFPLNGYHTYRFIKVPAGTESFAVDLELTRGESRKGALIGPNGKPVTGVRAYGLTSRWGNIQTLEADTFEVHGLVPGHPRRVIFARQDLHLVGSVLLEDDDIKGEAPLVVRMERAGSVKGRLVDEDGQPLSGARIGTMSFASDRMGLPAGPDGLWPDNESFTAGADGRFQVDGLKRDVKTTLSVGDAARPFVRLVTGDVLKDLTAEPGEVRDLGDVKVNVAAQ